MLTEIILEAWTALRRNYTRSLLTMLGIVWGIATVTLLIAYGSSFRRILVADLTPSARASLSAGRSRPASSPADSVPGKKCGWSRPTSTWSRKWLPW